MLDTHPQPAVIMATSRRSGSGLLSNLFSRNLGFACQEVRDWWNSDELSKLPSRQGDYQLWGLKAFPFNMEPLRREWPAHLPPLHSSHFIYLYREDTLAQAVSLVKASQSRIWHKQIGVNHNPDYRPTYTYNHSDIANALATYEKYLTLWPAYFAEHGIEPLTITYKNLCLDAKAQFQAICNFLKVPMPTDWKDTTQIQLRDAHSDEWIARFQAEQHLT